MELLRTITYQPAAGAKASEPPGKAGGGDAKRRRPPPPEEPPPRTQESPAAPQHRHHAGAEVSRVVVDPTTGRRYCRGRVLGKVRAPPRARRVRGAHPRGGSALLPCPGRSGQITRLTSRPSAVLVLRVKGPGPVRTAPRGAFPSGRAFGIGLPPRPLSSLLPNFFAFLSC